jgi:PAS domain S-box-containing protein
MNPLIHQPTLLIIDDTPSNLGVVVSLFEDRGYRIVIAQDGEEGVLRAQRVLPDLILLDVMMPGQDGFETCRCLKVLPETQNIPVIFMTALALSDHKITGFQAGAVDYITKPLQIDEVLARVETHLKLSAAQKKLAQYNDELERHVEIRTAELAAREREFRTLAENLPDNLARYDLEGRLTYMNGCLIRQLGRCQEEMLGKTPLEVRPGPMYEEYQVRLMETIRTGQPREMELLFSVGGKEARCHHIRFVAERDVSDAIVGVLTIGRDITAMKRAERELHVLNRALDNAFDATYLVDTDLRIRYVNEAAERELGYSREELLSMSLLDIDTNVTREMVLGLMEQTATSGRFPGTVESRHRRKNGEIFPIEVGATTFSYEGQHLFLTVVRNITERMEAQRKLHEKSQAILAVVENSPDTIIRYDSQCRRIYLNPAMEKIFGRPRHELIGISPAEFTPLPPLYLAKIKKTLETGSEQRMETSFRDAAGEMQWVDLRLAPEFDANGKVVTVLAIGRDITERKQAERELMLLTAAVNASTEAAFLLNARGYFVYVNDEACRSLGYRREELLGMCPLDIDPDLTPEFYGKLMEEIFIHEPRYNPMESHHRRKDGCIFPVEIIASPIIVEGKNYCLTMVRDITERKRIEFDLEESRLQLRGLTAQREQAREEERKYIAREIHDELGQILTGLKLSISVLNHKFAADSAHVRELWKDTLILTDRSLEVVRNVASALRPAALDMGIDSALEWLTGRFGTNTGIQCELRIADDDLHLEENRAIALFRIVQESLTNISRHAKADKVVVMLGKEANDFVLKICDNGVGFDPGAAKANSFGLVGIRERALILGGKVFIDSRPGEGTEIIVRIPAQEIQEK